MGRRDRFVAWGLLLTVLWLGCWAVTIVPDPAGTVEVWRWAVGNALAGLAGAAFGAAAVTRSPPAP